MHKFFKELPDNKVTRVLVIVVKILLFLLFISALALFVLNAFNTYKKNTKAEPSLYSNQEYNIVYMNGNLFYFCQLEDFNSEYTKCNNPYYLVKRKEAGADGKSEEKVYVTTPENEEIYQPEGSIFLKKENIVYVAKVGSESSVLEYINSQK